MRVLYILNESSDPWGRGDFEIYRTLDALLLYVEAIDVRNGESFAYVSDGRKITLAAASDYAPVTAVVEEEPRHKEELANLLRSILLYYSGDGRFAIDHSAAISQDLETLVSAIPDALISRG